MSPSRSVWDPTIFFTPEGSQVSYAVIVINQPLNVKAFDAVKSRASIVVCADGGANRLYATTIEERRDPDYLPAAVIGDLDSLKPEVEEYFRKRGVDIVYDPDQYATDLDKCLHWLRKHAEQEAKATSDGRRKDLDVVVLGGLGGRVDQGFSQIHHMYKASNDQDLLQGKMYLLSEQSISFILEEGVNKINCSPKAGPAIFGENVGIIPVNGKALISTKGLEWDVQDWPTQFGGQISTSNHIRADVIVIETNKHVLFTVELVPRFCAKD